MTTNRIVTYQFDFDNGTKWKYALEFDNANHFIPKLTKRISPWSRLNYCKCPNCPLNDQENPQCPVARNVDQIVEDSKDEISYTGVKVTVTTPEREYVKTCDAQNGLVSLFGLIMASSGCPHLDWLRPLARFHLPFASIDETLFRVLSLQLLTEFFSKQRKEVKDSAATIQKKYEEVSILNRAFISRIRHRCAGDADKNAIAALDIWIQAFEYYHTDDFKSLKPFFEDPS